MGPFATLTRTRADPSAQPRRRLSLRAVQFATDSALQRFLLPRSEDVGCELVHHHCSPQHMVLTQLGQVRGCCLGSEVSGARRSEPI